MPRIVLLSRSEFKNVKRGTQVYNQYLQQALPEMELFTLDQCPPIPKLLDRNLGRFCLETVKKSWWLCHHFMKKQRQNPYDLVITYSESGWSLALSSLSSRRLHIYTGCFAAYSDVTLKGKKGYFVSRHLYSPFEKWSGHKATCVAISGKVQQELAEHYKVAGQMIPVGIDLNQFVPFPAKRIGNPKCLFVGQAQYGKGWDIVVEMAKSFPHVQFISLLTEKITPTLPNIILKQNLSNEELCQLYNEVDFFLFPSRYESAALVVLEAMACNLPVIISQPVADVCIDGGISLKGVHIVFQDLPAAYKKAIEECLKQRQKAESRSYVEQNRSFARFQRSFRELVESILENKTREQAA